MANSKGVSTWSALLGTTGTHIVRVLTRGLGSTHAESDKYSAISNAYSQANKLLLSTSRFVALSRGDWSDG